MSSNEEYLDSLLKAVTTEGGAPAEDILESGSETVSGDEQDWDGISQYDLEKMLANVENMDAPETNLEEKMSEVYSGDDDEEKALSDPGALFFEGEEEYLDDGELESSKDGGAVSDSGAGEADDFSSLFFDNMEEEEPENDANVEKPDKMSGNGEKPDAVTPEQERKEAESDNKDNELSLDNVLSLEKEDAAEQENAFEEEDIIAAADNTEEEPGEVKEDLPAADENKEEDLIAAADSMEEDLIAAADSVEETQKDEPLEDEGFKEINDLLASSGGDDDDMFAMLEGVGNEEGGESSDIGIPEEEIKEKPETVESGKSKKKRKKKKTSGEETEGDDYEEGQNEKKPGIFARFINFLLEEDEEDEEEKKDTESTEEGEGAALGETTDENAAILEELEKEDAEKSGKKDKKKKKKGKKGKDEETASEGDEDEEEGDSGKKAKKKKQKKEKKEKSEEVFAGPTKKISAIKIEVTVVFCLSVLAAILLTVHLVPPEQARKSAREAYYAKDYESVIEGFYGEELSESDNLMYQRAYTVLRMQRKIEGYNDYMRMGKETEAVNQLIEGIVRYAEISEEASKYNVTEEVDAIYDMIAEALFNKYGVTPERAKELYGMTDNFAYTLALESIIDGVEYALPTPEGEVQPPAEEGASETEAVVQE